MITATKKTATKSLSIKELSAIYDRIYDIADKLFKRYNPCGICHKDNKTECINKHYKYNYLCCRFWDTRCKHWENGCTIKCLPCKLFMCGIILYSYDKNGKVTVNKKFESFIYKVKRLQKTVNKYGISNYDYYLTKKEVLQRRYRL